MNRRIIIRRAVAVLGGLSIPVAALLWSLWGAKYAILILHHVHDVASVIGPHAVYKSFGDFYISLIPYGVCAAAGLSFVFILWDRRPGQRRITAIFWIFFALLLPLAMLNYMQGDIFVSRMKQAMVDGIIVFLGIVILSSLVSLKPASTASRVLQVLAMIFVAAQAVFVPAILGTLWLLNWERAISLADSRNFAPGWITAAAGVASLAVAILQFRRSKPAEEPKPLIVLK